MNASTEAAVFAGYASLFGARDSAGDVVMPGAFRASLSARGPRAIKLLWQHEPQAVIGVWEDIREDSIGLRVRGRLIEEVAQGREAATLIDAGALDGLSIGFRTVRARRDAATGGRRLVEIDLWEISLVTFPVLSGARVELKPPAGEQDRADVRRLVARLGDLTFDIRRGLAA